MVSREKKFSRLWSYRKVWGG